MREDLSIQWSSQPSEIAQSGQNTKATNSFQNFSRLVIFPDYKACWLYIFYALYHKRTQLLLHCNLFLRATSERMGLQLDSPGFILVQPDQYQ